MRYLVVIEKTTIGYYPYSQDLEDCIASGATIEKVEEKMKEAIEFHLEGLKGE